MKKADVQMGETYLAKVTNKVVPVKILAENRHGGWDAINTLTKRSVRIKSVQRLRGKAQGKAKAERKLPSERLGVPPTTPDVDDKAAALEKKASAQTKRVTREKGATSGKRTSGLDAAARVLGEAGEPMGCKAMVETALEKGYWKTGGKTPAATIHAAIIREIAKKGEASRFVKTERGKFALAR